jgi:RNA polymerase sigma-70 factor (ECF subfamily)
LGSPAYVQNQVKVEEVDRDLVARSLDGDRDAFEAIVRNYQRRVYGVALRMTRRHEVADDIAQETFVRAYTRLHRFELGRPLAPWLTRIAANLSINYLTRAARREQPIAEEATSSGLPAAESEGSDPQRSLLSSEFASALDEAVDKLPPEQKAVFVLRLHEDMRYDAIAESLGISLGTVMSRLHRARAKLKVMLKDYM